MSLYIDNSLVQAIGLLDNLNLFKLKIWWKGLSTEDQEALCRVDSEDIVSGLVNATNKANYLCRLNQAYKKKELLSKNTITDQTGDVLSQMFEFNFIGKDIAKDDWENLLSCFYLSISPKDTSKTHIGVRRDKLSIILDLLGISIPSFGQGEKPVYDEQTLSKLFPSILSHSSKIRISILDLKPDLKTLFENLVAIAIMMEHQIYLAYFKQINSLANPSTSKVDQAVADQFSSLSTQLGLSNGKFSTPLKVKTVSQLERESDKPYQSLSAKNAQDNSPCSSQHEESASSSSTKSKLSDNESIRQFYEEKNPAYDGFFMDDLVIGFERFDCLLTSEEFLDANNEEQLEIIERKAPKEAVREEQDQTSDDESSLSQSSTDSFSTIKRMNNVQPYPLYQACFPQSMMPMIPFIPSNEPNFGSHFPPLRHQDNNFSGSDIPLQRKKSFESQSSQSSDREHFPVQGFQPFRGDFNSVENRTKTRHFSRPQLPPRLQKKKEYILRN